MPPAFITRIRAYLRPAGDKHVSKLRRRRKLIARLWETLPAIILALLAFGHLWLLAIPLSQFGQRTYIDENALQPGQVSTYWNWDEVHRADQYLTALEQLRDQNATSTAIADFLVQEFRKIGLPASTQQYNITTTSRIRNGTNAYAIFSSPRASGTEAIVISASWLSRTGEGDGTLNLRGVSTVLSLASFLKGYSLWAKDLVFVISDGYLEGMQAWITAYHGATQPNLQAGSLELSSGVIWNALNIDYPGHSFSHLGVFYEGINGRLPNQDLINSFQLISRYTSGVPVLLYDHFDHRDYPNRRHEVNGLPEWLPDFVKQNEEVNEYIYRAKNILRHVGYQARGRASGVHGLLHQFRIDAITIFAVPAPGPHGFHAIGRVVESTLRTMNNLLERLHASFFFYLLVGTTTFLKIGSYLPSAILISTAMLFSGLREWVNAGWIWVENAQDFKEKSNSPASGANGHWCRRNRPVMGALCVMIGTHALGMFVFYFVTRAWFLEHQTICSAVLFGAICVLSLMCQTVYQPPSTTTVASLPSLIKALNLCLASAVTSIISVLNFSLAAVLAISLGLPLCYSSSSSRIVCYLLYMLLGFGWLILAPGEVRRSVTDWELLRVWFAPFVCMVYAPLVLQAGIVCLLPA
ncbi:Gaa1-domain-containing protein [Wolfiporia cocos MD-104 SS10]|uniref:Gaa1-domain-containing protein n=1 Tax=Wolfiporia cocos (strain MD-104) TaxID=742152 RepID=A0A2H3JNF5_WOLCO|nr:Gaa1-domain-containing protein [Wolfiporia cocos MD-104 SS10]